MNTIVQPGRLACQPPGSAGAGGSRVVSHRLTLNRAVMGLSSGLVPTCRAATSLALGVPPDPNRDDQAVMSLV